MSAATKWKPLMTLADELDVSHGTLLYRLRAGKTYEGQHVMHRPATDEDRQRLGLTNRTTRLYRLGDDPSKPLPKRSVNNRLNQAQVDIIHRLKNEGVAAYRIAKRFDVSPSTVAYVIENRPPTADTRGVRCDRCGKRRETRSVFTLVGYVFCGSCHKWVFDHPSEAGEKFKGIF
jgi:transcriptional antiterminator